jgi:hypothetical protein
MIVKENYLVYIGDNIHFKKYSFLDCCGETDDKYLVCVGENYLGSYEKKLFIKMEQYKNYLVKERISLNNKTNKNNSIVGIKYKIKEYVCKKIRNCKKYFR